MALAPKPKPKAMPTDSGKYDGNSQIQGPFPTDAPGGNGTRSPNNFGTNLVNGIKTQITNALADGITGLISGKTKPLNNQATHGYGGLNNFINEIRNLNGIFKPTCFEVTLNGPVNQNKINTTFKLLCHQAAIPSINVETTKGEIYALPYEIPTGVSYTPFWCTFYIDNEFQLPNFIHKLIESKVAIPSSNNANGNHVNFSPRYRDDPTTNLSVDIVLFSTNKKNAATKVTQTPANDTGMDLTKVSHDDMPTVSYYTLKNAFIKSIKEVPLSWDSQNQFSSMTIEIAYEWYETGVGAYVDMRTTQKASTPPDNLAALLANNPILGTIYNAGKRTILNGNNSIMNSPLGNQASEFTGR